MAPNSTRGAALHSIQTLPAKTQGDRHEAAPSFPEGPLGSFVGFRSALRSHAGTKVRGVVQDQGQRRAHTCESLSRGPKVPSQDIRFADPPIAKESRTGASTDNVCLSR